MDITNVINSIAQSLMKNSEELMNLAHNRNAEMSKFNV